MTSTYTTNKNIQEPATGDLVNLWGPVNNANFSIIDAALGGVTNLNATGASGIVALTAAQYQPLILSISGTLTAAVNYQLPSGVGGSWIVKNATTGAFAVTISSAGGGSSTVIAQGVTEYIYSDGTNTAALVTPAFTGGSVANLITATGGIDVPITVVTATGVTLTSAVFGGNVIFINGPYTTTLPNPVTYNGASFNVWVNTGSVITLSTPSGGFYGGFGTSATTVALTPSIAVKYRLFSDGYNWIIDATPRIDSSGNTYSKNAAFLYSTDSGGTSRALFGMTAANKTQMIDGGGAGLQFMNQGAATEWANISASGIKATVGGIIFPDSTTQTTAATNTGKRILIATYTPSNVASVLDTTSISGSYTEYEIVCENMVGSGTSPNLNIQFYIGGVVNSGYWGAISGYANGTVISTGLSGSALQVSASFGATSAKAMAANIRFSQPASGKSIVTATAAQGFDASNYFVTVAGGSMTTAGAITGFQLLFSSGNITSGIIKVYGWN